MARKSMSWIDVMVNAAVQRHALHKSTEGRMRDVTKNGRGAMRSGKIDGTDRL
jgi:hypothetical protein